MMAMQARSVMGPLSLGGFPQDCPAPSACKLNRCDVLPFASMLCCSPAGMLGALIAGMGCFSTPRLAVMHIMLPAASQGVCTRRPTNLQLSTPQQTQDQDSTRSEAQRPWLRHKQLVTAGCTLPGQL